MTERPTTDEIEQAITADSDAWRVTDWTEVNKSGSPATLEVEFEHIPRAERLDNPARQIKETIKEFGGDDGAKIETVVSAVADRNDSDPDAVRSQIERLRTKGEVYEPRQGQLRTT